MSKGSSRSGVQQEQIVKGDWVALLPISELPPSGMTSVLHDRRELLIYDCADGVYVSAARCTHAGARLCDGYLEGHLIECPLHQGAFDLRTGKPMGAPVTRSLAVWPCRVRRGIVEINR